MLNPDSAAASTASGSAPKVKERQITLLGAHKRPLFDKLCAAADRHERHVQYQDVHYLYLNVDGEPQTIELTCVGTEHTGAREMAIRKAEAVILSYAARRPQTFQGLAHVVDDFKMRKGGKMPPVLLVCDEDELVDAFDQDEGAHSSRSGSAASSGSSEGYESGDGEAAGRIRRPSMENVRRSQEEPAVTEEQGETFAKQFGVECHFVSAKMSTAESVGDWLRDLIRRVSVRPQRRRSTFVDGLRQLPPFQRAKKRDSSSHSSNSDTSRAASIDSPLSRGSPQDETAPRSASLCVASAILAATPVGSRRCSKVEPTDVAAVSAAPIPKPKRGLFRRNQTAPAATNTKTSPKRSGTAASSPAIASTEKNQSQACSIM